MIKRKLMTCKFYFQFPILNEIYPSEGICCSLGEDLLAVVEVEMPLEVPDHLVTEGALLLQRFPQVNSLHVKSEVAATVGLVVALATSVIENLLVDGVDVFVEKFLPLELFTANLALETLPGPLMFRPVALQTMFENISF